MSRGRTERYVTLLTIAALLVCLVGIPLVSADSVTGPGNLKSYYFDDEAQKGFLNLTDGQTWTLTVTGINASQITGNKVFQFFLQDYGTGSGWEMVTVQVHVDYYGFGGHLFQSYDKGWVLKSSQIFPAGGVLGEFDLRMQIKDQGTNYQVTPQYRLSGGNWQTFQGGSWLSATYELTQAYLAMQIDAGSDGMVIYDTPTAHSEDTWYVDKAGKVQNATEDASPGKTVVIYGGTHLESLYVNKSLTIRGIKNPIVRGSGLYTVDYGGTQLTRESVIFITNSTNLVLQGLDIQGDGLGPENNAGVFFIYSEAEMKNCSVSPNTAGDMGAWGIEARASRVEVHESIIENFGKTGIYFGNCSGGVYNSTIEGNVYTDPDKAGHGIEVDVYRQGPSDVGIVGNEILNCDNTYSPEPSLPSIGVAIDLWRRYDNLAGSSVVVENNKIHDNYEGFEIVTSNNTCAHYNSIFDNRHGVIVDPDYLNLEATFDARFNWWGESSGPTHSSNAGGTGDSVSDYVDYSPWLNSSFETVPRVYHVNPTGTIQEGIDAASAGELILVDEGAYDEQLLVSKNLTVQGIGTSVVVRPSSEAKLESVLEAPWQRSTKKIAAVIAVNVTAGSNVVVKNLGIDGCNVASVPSDADFVVGILYLETGGMMDTLNVSNIMQEDSQYGSGIYIASEVTPATVEVGNSTITNFRRNGIEASGGTSSSNLKVNIHGNTLNGRGPLGVGEPAQNGIVVTGASFAVVTNNTVGDLMYTGTGDTASGIMFFEASGTASENSVANCQAGMATVAEASGSWDVTFENNRINGANFTALHARVRNVNASINLILLNNNLTGGSGDGINIGLSPPYSPAGKITLTASANMIAGWNCGIRLVSSISENSTIGGNTITNSVDSGIRIEQSLNASNVVVTYNTITQNINFGIFNNGSGILDARYNWWGDPSGPYHQQLNPLGKGNKVSNNVNFKPWLTEQPGLPRVAIEPPSSIAAIGETLDIRVDVTNITRLTGWEFKLYYKNDVVNCTGVVEGPFLQTEGSTFFIKQMDNTYNSTHGRLLLACSLLGQNISVSGSGTLATMTFKALARGNTTLDLVDTKLSDERIPPQPIPHGALDGEIQVDVIVEIDPPYSQVVIEQVFSVNAAIRGVSNLTGWEFKAFYRNDVVNCTGVVEGPFLKIGGSTFFIKQINNAYNATHGRLLVACSLQGQNVSVNGSGIIATIFFKAIGTGTTIIDLADTKLSDEKIPPQPIPHLALDGTIRVGGPHDIAVGNVTTSKTGCKPMPTAGLGYSVKVNVTVCNNGEYAETFNVTAYVNSTALGTLTVGNLSQGAQTSVSFAWNTSSFGLGNYTISSYAEPVPGEIHVEDNTLSDGKILVTIAGDINGDSVVDIFDAILLSGAFNSQPGGTHWNPNADIDCSNIVDIFDAIILASHFNAHWSP